jgi:hypothetical protein
MKKVLNFFGLSLKKDLELTLKENLELKNSILEKDKILNSLESFDDFVPEVNFKEYEKTKSGKIGLSWDSELFHEFYNIYHRNQRQAYLIRKLAHKDYKMLHVFLMEFSSFDWNSTKKYMEEIGWTWNNSKESPTVEMLKNAVIELINFNFSEGSCILSGGFYLSLFYKSDGEPFCKIEFKKKDFIHS